ncbi:MAG TPA: alpha/beta hydrolase [Puia sp.]|nr:alpha/beta hydrolase [Puia sp.]
MTKEIYCISGLGADQQIFSHLKIPGVRLLHLAWLIPFSDESIEAYALRMKAGIDGDDPILLGVSFGGMMAVEIAKYYPAATVILVSSIGSRHALPWWMSICGRWGLNRLMPARPGKGIRWLENYYLSVETPEDARLANEFRGKTDPHYLKWALDRIVNWRNEWIPSQLYHLHGSRDRMFPLRRVKATHVVREAGHFMVNNRAGEISNILDKILNSP